MAEAEAQGEVMKKNKLLEVKEKFLNKKAELEKEKLAQENKLLQAKTENLQSMARMEELYAEAIKAMQNYSGNGDPDEY